MVMCRMPTFSSLLIRRTAFTTFSKFASGSPQVESPPTQKKQVHQNVRRVWPGSLTPLAPDLASKICRALQTYSNQMPRKQFPELSASPQACETL